MNRTRWAAAVLGASVLLLVATATALPETEAAWTKAERGTGSFTGGVMQSPGTLTCSGGGSALLSVPNLTFSWAAPASPANAAVITEYRWTLMQGATVTASGTTAPGTRSVSLAGNGYAFGNHTFSVVAASGNWVSAPGPTGTYIKTNNLITLIQTASCTIP